MTKNFLTSFALIFLLSGCTPSFNFSTQDITLSQQKLNLDLTEITITIPSEEPLKTIKFEECSKEDVSSNFIPSWGVSLVDALKKSKIFTRPTTKKVNLLVTILEIDMPFFATDVTTKVSSNYKLIDDVTKVTLYDDTVKTEATIPWNYSFFGYERGLESVNRAVQKNISTFISNLQKYSIKKNGDLTKEIN